MSNTSDENPPATTAPDDVAARGGRAVAALLREHPDAMVVTQLPDALVVPPPESLGLDAPVLASEGRALMDLCVAEDRMASVKAWIRVKNETMAQVTVRLCSNPEQWMAVQMVDLRSTHGVVLNVLWPTSDAPEDEEARVSGGAASTTPRFCTRKQDEEGNVLACDEAYVQMFGYSEEQVVGQPTFERVHSDDQARVIEGWIAAVSTGRTQMFRIRMKRSDDSWLWVDTTLHNFLSDPEHPHVLAECIDVSAEMSAQEALQDREELLRNLIEEMPDGLLQLDRERRLVYHNARLLEIMRAAPGAALHAVPKAEEDDSRGPEQLTLALLLAALSEQSRSELDTVLERILVGGAREDIEVELAPPFGQPRHVLMKIRPLQRGSGVVTGAIASVLDVTDSARARRELELRATFDALTGAHNRASIMAALSAELERSTDTAVVYVDLDHFKSINDSFGHAAGDAVLAAVAERLRGAMRSSDELGRLGGDEFIVLLRGASSLAVAMSAAQRLSDAVRGTYELTGASLELCASVGVACAENDARGAEELVERGDAAMYRSKEQRRGIPVLAA